MCHIVGGNDPSGPLSVCGLQRLEVCLVFVRSKLVVVAAVGQSLEQILRFGDWQANYLQAKIHFCQLRWKKEMLNPFRFTPI